MRNRTALNSFLALGLLAGAFASFNRTAAASEQAKTSHGSSASAPASKYSGSSRLRSAPKRAGASSASTAHAAAGRGTRAAAQNHGATPAAASAHAPAAHTKLETPAAIWEDLLEGNRRFVAGKPQPRPLVSARLELAKGQHPQAIILGCADSRTSPELLFDKNLGELFVIRTAGNVADPIALGSIEYAVEHLHTKVLVVLGHEKCGAVAAAASRAKMPTPNLEAIVSKITPALDQLKACGLSDAGNDGIHANVRRSASDVVANSPILQQALAQGRLTIITAVYRLQTGEVVQLQ